MSNSAGSSEMSAMASELPRPELQGMGSRLPSEVIGVVRDMGTGEEVVAQRDGGAWLDGHQIPLLTPADRLEMVAIEGTKPSRVAAFAGALPQADRLRGLGSLALSLFSATGTDHVDGGLGLRRGDDAAPR